MKGQVAIRALSMISNAVYDLQVEMQNHLVGGLFETRLKYREPLDPRSITIRLDRYDELMDHFEENTEWGRRKAKADANNKEKFSQADTGETC